MWASSASHSSANVASGYRPTWATSHTYACVSRHRGGLPQPDKAATEPIYSCCHLHQPST
ncbi:hypothetical protein GCM10027348_14980 [Hymenobacter tenuis]